MSDMTPPSGARREAKQALEWRRLHGRGGTAVGVARARDISNGVNLSESTVRRMKAYFDRHDGDQKAEGFRHGEDGYPSAGRISWGLWGGDSGRAWAERKVASLNSRSYGQDREKATIDVQGESRMDNVERRFISSVESAEKPDFLEIEERADPSTGVKNTYLVGYAAKFGEDSVLLGDFIERIEPSAFDIVKAGKDKNGKPLATRGLFNHDPNYLIARYPNTMKLTVDAKGLRYEMLLPECRKDLAEMVRRGDLRGSSFSFVVAQGGEKWSYEKGQSIRTVTAIKTLVDCGPVTFPAYDSSTVAVAQRSYQQFKKQRNDEMKPEVNFRDVFKSEIEKNRQFIEQRAAGGDCGRDSDGKFGSGNTCAGGGSTATLPRPLVKGKDSLKSIGSALTKGAEVGGLVGAGWYGAAGASVGGAIGGVSGAAKGAAIGAIKGGTMGAVAGAAAHAAVYGVNAVADKVGEKISPSTDKGSAHLASLVGAAIGSVAFGIPGALAGAAIGNLGAYATNAIADYLGADTSGEKRIQKFKELVGPDGKAWDIAGSKDKVVSFTDAAGKHVMSFTKSSSGKVNAHVTPDWGNLGTDAPRYVEEMGRSLGSSSVSTSLPRGTEGGVVAGKYLVENGFKKAPDSFRKTIGESKGLDVYVKKLNDSTSKRFDELVEFFVERRASDDCGRTDDGKFGSGNNCGGGGSNGGFGGGNTPPPRGGGGGKKDKPSKTSDSSPTYYKKYDAETAKKKNDDTNYMEWNKGDHKDPVAPGLAQKFLDSARKGQLERGGKDEGKSDDGGGVQTWSKGEHFPWTIHQKGSTEGHVQGQHPDGSKTKKYPFYGGDSKPAHQQVFDEIARHKKAWDEKPPKGKGGNI